MRYCFADNSEPCMKYSFLQCAHGRPTTVPLVDLKALHKGILNLRSWHDYSGSTWHGLCKNKISLDRAKHRLDIARGCG